MSRLTAEEVLWGLLEDCADRSLPLDAPTILEMLKLNGYSVMGFDHITPEKTKIEKLEAENERLRKEISALLKDIQRLEKRLDLSSAELDDLKFTSTRES